MNKFVKGSIAAAAATVLLLGGAGSLAYWNSSANLADYTVSTGTLQLTAGTELWTGAATAGTGAWVPGDSATYNTTLTLVAGGTNIRGTIALDQGSIAVSPTGRDNPLEIAFAVDTAAAVTPAGAALAFAAGELTFDGAGTYTIPVTVTADFPFGAAVDNDSQSLSVNLDNVTFTATQTAP